VSAALRHVFIASLARRRLATALSLFAIALGVALGLAVQLIHGAALDEFGRGMRLLAGEADLQVVGGRGGFDDGLYVMLAQRPEVAQASPLLEIEARLPGRDRTLRIFGIDALRAAHVQPALMPLPEADGDGFASALSADALFLAPAARAALALAPGGTLAVQGGLREAALRIAGSVPGAGVGQALAVMDIAAAQQLFARVGRLTRIDLRLARGVDRAAAEARLRPLLPAGVTLLAPEAAQAQVAGLSRAYRVNLTMLAVIALLTGGFLVFSTQLLAVVRRRQELAFLRALGVDRPMLFGGLLAEGAAVGLVGGLLGVALGYGLTALAFRLVGGDLGAGYFEGVAPQLRFEPLASAGYLLLGLAAGVAGGYLPAREATRLQPARALRAGDEADLLQARPRWLAALTCAVLAALACLIPPVGGVPLFGYVAVALVLTGSVLALPGAARQAMRALAGSRPVLLRLAHARLAAAPGQTVVAGAGVVASVALAVAMAIMVSSFRASVDAWLAQVLPADLYVRASSSGASGHLPPEVVARVAALPGVAAARPVRYDTLRLSDERVPVTLIARVVADGGALPLVAGEGGNAVREQRGPPPVWISEAMADLFGLRVGDGLTLPLAGSGHAFRVAGIWRDYARQHGAVVMELTDYRARTGDPLSNDIAVSLAPGATVDAVSTALRAALDKRTIEIALPGEIRVVTLAIFDRTFLVTYLMEAVAVLIGLFGISTSFAALATARRKEFGMLRHLGLTRTEIGRLLALEGALTAAVGVAVGTAAGGAIALILIEVINRQSFHWSMDVHLPLAALAAFAAALVLLAALAARLSGHQAMRQNAVLAVREDW
jgi:putative ABC transport system permease protein